MKKAKNLDLKREKKFGIKKGEKLGKQKNQIQVVKAMLKENADINFISKVTGLTKEEIENISNK